MMAGLAMSFDDKLSITAQEAEEQNAMLKALGLGGHSKEDGSLPPTSPRLVSPHFASSRLIASHLTTSHLISSHLTRWLCDGGTEEDGTGVGHEQEARACRWYI